VLGAADASSGRRSQPVATSTSRRSGCCLLPDPCCWTQPTAVLRISDSCCAVLLYLALLYSLLVAVKTAGEHLLYCSGWLLCLPLL
jgi:hypothetical protein